MRTVEQDLAYDNVKRYGHHNHQCHQRQINHVMHKITRVYTKSDMLFLNMHHWHQTNSTAYVTKQTFFRQQGGLFQESGWAFFFF